MTNILDLPPPLSREAWQRASDARHGRVPSLRDLYAMAIAAGMMVNNNSLDVARVFLLADELLQQRGGGKIDEEDSAR